MSDLTDIDELLREVKSLKEQRDQLQIRGTALLMENRALKQKRTALSGQVEAFHHAMGIKTLQTVGIPADGIARLRGELTLEEAFEFAEAILDPECVSYQELLVAKDLAKNAVRQGAVKVNLAKAVDALADCDYVNEGGRQAFGIYDGTPIADEVQRANITKVGGPKDPVTGKQLKPAGWTPPDIDGVLLQMGWPPKE
jgi:predicted HAD superfamily Cof-like phosphohydrolase